MLGSILENDKNERTCFRIFSQSFFFSVTEFADYICGYYSS